MNSQPDDIKDGSKLRGLTAKIGATKLIVTIFPILEMDSLPMTLSYLRRCRQKN